MKNYLIIQSISFLLFMNTSIECIHFDFNNLSKEVVQEKIADIVTKNPAMTSVAIGLVTMKTYEVIAKHRVDPSLFVGYQSDDRGMKFGIGVPGFFIGYQHTREVNSQINHSVGLRKEDEIIEKDTISFQRNKSKNSFFVAVITALTTYGIISHFSNN